MKHYKSVSLSFYQILERQAPCTNVKPPYWRLLVDGSGCHHDAYVWNK